MNKTSEINVLIPEYMKKFQCIGPTCEDTCCKEFDVLIDKKTYKLYKNERDIKMKTLFRQYVSRNKSSDVVNDGNYAKVNLVDDGCPFLDDDKLCVIYSNMGEQALSITCHSYPRIYNICNNTLEKSAMLSCPEIARLALLNEQKMEFEFITSEESKKYISKRVVIQEESETKNFWTLRSFIIELLQNRTYSIEDRLIILGLFLTTHDEYIAANRIDEVDELINDYQEIIDSGEMKSELETIVANPVTQIALLKEISEMRTLGKIKSKRYLNHYSEVLQGLQFSEDDDLGEMGQLYSDVYVTHYKPFMDTKEYIYENYLVNYVFMNLFPFGTKMSAFENYSKLVINYALVKMHLIGTAGFYKDQLNDENVIAVMQSYSKVFGHNDKFFNVLLDILKVSTDDLMMHLAIMIRN